MRLPAPLAFCALLALPVSADPLVVVSKKDLDGTIVGLTAVRRGDSHTLAALVVRGARTEFWIVDTAARPTAVSTIAGAGVPAVVFGPGDIAKAHTCDEWVSLDEVERASEILYRLARQG